MQRDQTDRRAHPGFDALRAIAVLSVAWWHWAPVAFGADWPGRGFPFGLIGVQLFFALSGFLITNILLDAVTADATRGERLRAIWAFIVRRALRLFPAYYFLIALSCIIGVWPFRDYLPFLLTYSQNFAFFFDQTYPGPASHLWTLALEEQFYLCWPWLCLFITSILLVRVLFAFIVLCIGASIAASLLAPGTDLVSTLPVPGLLSIASGCLLAIVIRHGLSTPVRNGFFCALAIVSLVAGLILLGHLRLPGNLAHTIFLISTTLLAVVIVALSRGRITGRWGAILDSRPLQALGRVSYGFYLYHLLAPIALSSLERRGVLENAAPLLQLTFMLAFTLAVTIASWFLIERPVLGLKGRFPYRRHGAGAAT